MKRSRPGGRYVYAERVQARDRPAECRIQVGRQILRQFRDLADESREQDEENDAEESNGKQHQREDTEPAPDPVTLEPSDDRVEEVGDAEGDDEGYERTLQHEEKAEEHGEGRRHHDPNPDGPVDERPVVARPGGRACTHAE